MGAAGASSSRRPAILAQDLPEQLRRLKELAGFAEALWVLDQPPERFDLAAMTRESLSSLRQVTDGRERLLALPEMRRVSPERVRAPRASFITDLPFRASVEVDE